MRKHVQMMSFQNKSHLLFLCFVLGFLSSKACDTTKIIAHRGVSSLAPQNTLAAFQLGIDMGVDYLELDVQQSSDDSLMVIHDATLNSTTNGAGNVIDKTYLELKTLDAGSWFSPNFIGEQIPTLYEALALAKGKAKVCVELKAANIEAQAVSMIEDLGMVDDVVIFSFDLNQLYTIKTLNNDLKICYLNNPITITDIYDLWLIGGEIVGSDGSGFDEILYAQNLDIQFWKWTINNTDDMLYAMSKGVDGIITDYPQDLFGLKTLITNYGLMAHWDFNQGSGVFLDDQSGNGNDGIIYGPSWSAGNSGGGLSFDGNSDSVVVPLSSSLDISGDGVSISGWVYLDVLPSGMPNSFGPIYDSDEDAYILYLDKTNSELRFKVKDNDGDAERPGIAEADLSLGTWMHVVGVYNGYNAMIYLNGVMKDYHGNANLDLLQTGQQACFGYNNGGFFDGMLDEFRIYNRALTRQEVSALYTAGMDCITPADETISLEGIGLAENSDHSFCDSGLVACSQTTLPRTIFQFDGSLDFLNVNNMAADLAGRSHCFFAWIKTTNPSNDERLFAINDMAGGNVSLFGIYNGAIDIYVPSTYFTGITPVNDGNWHFVGYSWSISLQQLKLWVDGNLDATYTVNLVSSTTDLVSIGQEYDLMAASNKFNGQMAEISIWNEVLTTQEISQLMLEPIDSNHNKYGNLVGYYNTRSGCDGQLKDRSSFGNHGTCCQDLNYTEEVLPGFVNTDYSISWDADVNGNVSDSSSASFIAQQSQVLVYTADDGYGTTYYDSIYIDVFPSPVTSAISGEDTALLGLTEVYQVTGSSGSIYDWVVSGGTIDAGSGTESIAVTWDTEGVGLLAAVETDTNGCIGDTVTFSILVKTPCSVSSTITGEDTVLLGLTEVYQVTGSNGSVYDWVVSGGTIDAGNGTESIAVTWDTEGMGSLAVVETDTNGCIGDTVTFSILVKTPSTGMNEDTPFSATVFPNPFTEKTTIAFNNPEHSSYKLKIYNLLGDLVYLKQNIRDNQVVIVQEDLSPGLFLFELNNGNVIAHGKLIRD